jgi:DNA polymerase III delta prime subunit
MIRSTFRYLRRVAFGAPELVAFIGPDGSGKTTLTHALARQMGCAVDVWKMPQPSRWEGRALNRRLLDLNARLRRDMMSRRPGPRRKAVAALTHTLEYLEQHLRLARILTRSPGMTFTDGYAWEPVIRWRRESATMPFWWRVLVARLFPRPRLVILCGGDPEAIWRRKPEMVPWQIRATGRRYRALLRRMRVPFLEVDTTAESIEETIRRVSAALGMEAGSPPPLRQVDWRFLLPSPSSQSFRNLVLLGGSPALGARLEGEGVAERVTHHLPENGSVDAVVVLAAAKAVPSLDRLRQALPAGGVLYYEVDRRAAGGLLRTPARVRRSLAALGMTQTGAYWVRPSFARRRLHLPIDRPGTLSWYLNTTFAPATIRERMLGWWLRRFTSSHLDLATAVITRFAVTATVGPGEQQRVSALSPADLPAALRDPAVRPAMVTHGIDDLSRVVLLPFSAGGDRPLAVVKLPRLTARNGLYEREQEGLSALRGLVDARLAAALPEPLGLVRWRGVAMGIESYLPGDSLARGTGGRRGREAQTETFRLAAGWLTEFHLQARISRTTWNEEEQEVRVEAPVRAYLRFFDPGPEQAQLLDGLRSRTRSFVGREIPLVWQHDDYLPRNIASDGGQIRVFDWEGAAPGLPLLDLLDLASDWYAMLEGHRREAERLRGFRRLFLETPARGEGPRLVDGALRSYEAWLELPGGYRPAALTLGCLYRALSIHERHEAGGRRAGASPPPNRGRDHLRLLAEHRRELFGADAEPARQAPRATPPELVRA